MKLARLTHYASRIVIGILIGVTFALLILSVRLMWFDPRDFFTYQGISGPFAVTEENGAPQAGRPISQVHPGDRFAWISTLCFAADVSAHASVALRNLGTNLVVSQQAFDITPSDRRCGPKLFVLQVPADAAPGRYEVDRSDVITPPHRWPMSSPLPPINIEVTAP